jgi:hypothetical protein
MFFDPNEHQARIIAYYPKAPNMRQMFRLAAQEGHSLLECTDQKGEIKVFFVPQHQLRTRVCSLGRLQHLLTKVSRNSRGKPKFWLMTCVFNQEAWLFPYTAFNERAEYQPTKREMLRSKNK